MISQNKKLVLCALAALTMTTAAACGSKPAAPETTAAPTAAAAETTTAATTPVAPPPMDQVLIWSNGENITLYPAQSMNYAWSGARGWVPLDPGMYVAKNGQWVPIQLDAQGRIIL